MSHFLGRLANLAATTELHRRPFLPIVGTDCRTVRRAAAVPAR
jgi:hypothetical protein